MKMTKVTLLSALVLLLAGASFAQEREMELEAWEKAKTDAQATVDNLKKQSTDCKTDNDGLKARVDELNKQAEALEAEILALVEADAASKSAYARELEAVDGKIRQMAALSADDLFARRAELDAIEAEVMKLKEDKLSLLPENARKIEAMLSQIDKLRKVRPTTKSYTVGTWAKDRDCLWNIAKKRTIFDNPFKWPSIYQANRDKIKDPDLIYPGQVLTIPNN